MRGAPCLLGRHFYKEEPIKPQIHLRREVMDVPHVVSYKREALDRYRRALKARIEGKISDLDLSRVRAEVLEVSGVEVQNLNEISKEVRSKYKLNKR
jgi:O-phosphoseryl-tRNA(Cys) synthetase